MTPQASFDRTSDGFRFTLRYSPPHGTGVRGVLILAPPFAEEMNHCRRMTALAARRLAEVGWHVIERDLLGCGDSSGEFADASWLAWQDDLRSLVAEVPEDVPLWLWGSRAGALLLPAALELRPDANVVLWQPLHSGRAALSQFLRLKTVSAAMNGSLKIDTAALRATLSRGQSLEVAGYTLSPAVAHSMDAASFVPPAAFTGRVLWLEVSATEPPSLAPAGNTLRTDWLARGFRVDARAVAGEQFWQTPETADCPTLIDEMVRLMRTT